MYKAKDCEWPTFVVFMSFSACSHLHARLHSPWFYVTVGMKICDHLWYKLTGGSHVFSSWENKSWMCCICTDICAEVSGYFHPNFHYTSVSSEINVFAGQLTLMYPWCVGVCRWTLFMCSTLLVQHVWLAFSGCFTRWEVNGNAVFL